MKDNDFRNYRYKIILGCVCFSLICSAVSLFFVRGNLSLIGGIFAGTVVLCINLLLLELAIVLMVRRNRIAAGIGIHIARFLIYGITGVLTYKVSTLAIIGYGISVLGLPVSSGIIFLRKEGADGKL